MNRIEPENIRTESIKNLYQPYGVEMDVLRLDMVHPIVSGNKWFKLRFYLEKARQLNKKGILTFGGAYSNHIVATAEACRLAGLASAGIIRGERLQFLSHTLQHAERSGMKLYFITRDMYSQKMLPPDIITDVDEWLMVNEGGYGPEGVRGAATIMKTFTGRYDYIISATGTGTTLAGLATSGGDAIRIGISVFKNNASLQIEINSLLPEELHNKFQLIHDFHFGGYAKYNSVLIQFMNEWYRKTKIATDFVYTGKMFFAADTMIRSGYFRKGARILTIHTGGLQGNASLPKGKLIFDQFPA